MLVRLAWGNVRKSLADFGIYFLTVLLGVAVFYAFNSMTAQQGVLAFSQTQDKMFELLGMVIGGVSVFIAFVLVFLVVYANRFLIKRRKREFGIYLALGMGTAEVVKIVALESLVVGVASLVAGLAVGVGLSQLLLLVTSALFQAEVAANSGFAFVFSREAFVKTLVVFVVIFVLAALFNARTVSKTRLIDLMHAENKHEDMKLRSLPWCFLLFIIAVVLIGSSYRLLIDNGLMSLSPEFLGATVLVCVGTILFFYALAGFLLRLVQMVRSVYLRGLNMFTLRQLSAQVNTTFISLSIVCMVLFLALVSVSGGMGIRTAIEGSLEKGTAYSASVSTVFGTYTKDEGFVPEDLGAYGVFAQEKKYDMADGLRESAQTLTLGSFDDLVESSAQVDLLIDPDFGPTAGDIEKAGNLRLSDYAGSVINPGYERYPVYLARLSQVNEVLELAGKPPVQLGDAQCAVLSDNDATIGYYQALVEKGSMVEVNDTPLEIALFSSESLLTTPFPLNTGTLVIPDEVVPENAVILQSFLNVQCRTEADEVAFGEMCDIIAESSNPHTWPIALSFTRTKVAEQSMGFSTVVAYLAIYLGFVLVVACAAILAIQQLSSASDNARRYGLLRKLGAPKSMISCSLFVQVMIYFLFPLVLAVAHAACALVVVADVVAVFGHLDIGEMTLICSACFLAVYGMYFIVTYLGAKKLTAQEVALSRVSSWG